jgi:hypothetical protein
MWERVPPRELWEKFFAGRSRLPHYDTLDHQMQERVPSPSIPIPIPTPTPRASGIRSSCSSCPSWLKKDRNVIPDNTKPVKVLDKFRKIIAGEGYNRRGSEKILIMVLDTNGIFIYTIATKPGTIFRIPATADRWRSIIDMTLLPTT